MKPPLFYNQTEYRQAWANWILSLGYPGTQSTPLGAGVYSHQTGNYVTVVVPESKESTKPFEVQVYLTMSRGESDWFKYLLEDRRTPFVPIVVEPGANPKYVAVKACFDMSNEEAACMLEWLSPYVNAKPGDE